MEQIETGRIVNTHGVKGEMKVVPWTDDANVFFDFTTLYVDGTAYAVKGVRMQGANVLLRLEGIDDLTAAERLKNKTVYADRADFDLPEGTFFIADLLGMTVVKDETGETLGTLTDVIATGANDVYELTADDGSKRYFPAIKDCVKHTDPIKKEMRIHVMEGLFDV